MKVCNLCHESKSLDDFLIGTKYRGGRRGTCKLCARISRHNKDNENLELARARWRTRKSKWVAKNIDRHHAWQRRDSSHRRATARGADGHYSTEDIVRIFTSQKQRCAYFGFCGRSIKLIYHIDHIVPLAKGGSNWPRNIQLTCPECNFRKNALDPLDFAKKQGALL